MGLIGVLVAHNGAVVTLLAVCGSTHRESYLNIVMVAIVSALIALVASSRWARHCDRSEARCGGTRFIIAGCRFDLPGKACERMKEVGATAGPI